MGKQSRRKQAARRERAEASRELIGRRLAGLGTLAGVIRIKGRPTAVIEPAPGQGDPFELDKALCAAGIRRFARPRNDEDWPDRAGCDVPADVDHVLVEELAPGVRHRKPIRVVWSFQSN